MQSHIHIDGQGVRRVVLGAARWSLNNPLGEAEAEALIALAITAGIGAIDTARAYTPAGVEGHNEKLIAKALDRLGMRDQLIVTTKGGHYRDGSTFRIDASPAALREDCMRSIQALGVEQLGLYYLHFPDPAVPIAESVEALENLRHAGHIRHIGLCNVDLTQLQLAQEVAEISAVQHRHSMHEPADPQLINYCAQNDITFLGYSPLGGSRARTFIAELSDRSATSRIAREQGVSKSTVVLAWLLQSNPQIGLLSGAGSKSSIESSAAAADLALSQEHLAAIRDEYASSSPFEDS